MRKDGPRMEYRRAQLSERDVLDDPFAQFSLWWNEAIAQNLPTADAVTLATVDEHGHPNARIVLLKSFDTSGFVFFTNYESAKARELSFTPYAAINIFWPEFERQIRMRGQVKKTSLIESNKYFTTRPRGSQIAAWSSPQSKAIKDRSTLLEAFAAKEREFADIDISCPPYWGGFRLSPDYFEFWQGRENRLHDRFSFRFTKNTWIKDRLAP